MPSLCRRSFAPSSGSRAPSTARPALSRSCRWCRRSRSASSSSAISCAALPWAPCAGRVHIMAQVKITGLHKRFAGGVQAVRGIDLEIADGELTVLVGPSGCGKSTLLRTIAGLEDADEGQIEISGEVVNDIRPRDRDVAMVFQ